MIQAEAAAWGMLTEAIDMLDDLPKPLNPRIQRAISGALVDLEAIRDEKSKDD